MGLEDMGYPTGDDFDYPPLFIVKSIWVNGVEREDAHELIVEENGRTKACPQGGKEEFCRVAQVKHCIGVQNRLSVRRHPAA